MSPNVRLRQRISVILHMVIAFVVTILLAQLWLFTVALDAVESPDGSTPVAVAALTCSIMACGAVWALIRFFFRAEKSGL